MVDLEETIWRIHIEGIVQSVGFRPFIKNLADRMGIPGIVKNLGAEGVEILTKEERTRLDDFIELIHSEAPPLAEISTISIDKIQTSHSKLNSTTFEIAASEMNTQSSVLAPIPPDISICIDCRGDIVTEGRRYQYPFTSCTNCGPRYTTIQSLPYDRERTSFMHFPLCDLCFEEYETPSNRRFHAQTTACSVCGPRYRLFKRKITSWEEIEFSWSKLEKIINKGQILAAMGLGGTHYIVDAYDTPAISRLRSHRRMGSNKPFAVMVKDISTAKDIADITDEDAELLTSLRKPIVILPLIDHDDFPQVSPGLTTIGVMLPYSGFHHLLFDLGVSPVLLMTSANLPNLPMPITPQAVLDQSIQVAEYALVHDREIVQRIDDSVIRSFGTNHRIIRRARGFVPYPLFFPFPKELPPSLALGAEQVNTSAIAMNGKIVASQHIGDVTSVEMLEFQQSTIQHLRHLYRIDTFDHIAIDLHPSFLQRHLLDQFITASLHEVQHHVAHTASLALDNGIRFDEPFLAWACDGYGYGIDGNGWGGELILLDGQGGWTREGTISPVSYRGGDTNALYPGRMLAYYILANDRDPMTFFKGKEHQFFRHGKQELEILLTQQDTTVTSSIGRFLDASSALLGISNVRSYRGEPAIRLEDVALRSSRTLEPTIYLKTSEGKKQVDTIALFDDIFQKYKTKSMSTIDIAKYLHLSLGHSLADLGTQLAIDHDISHLGFTGGVAYNRIINNSMRDFTLEKGLQFLTHNTIPPGDAGISSGQIYEIGRSLSQ